MAVVLVTGCSSGIGRGLVEEFAKQGCKVYASARRVESLKELQEAGFNILQLDVTSADSIKAAVDSILAKEGRIDVLVNNAGINLYGPVIEQDMQDIRAIFETNVIGLLAVTKVVAPTMIRQKSGKIVNVGSSVGVVGTPFAGPYSGSKAAVELLSQSLRLELEPFGIQVMNVCPGGIVSKISENGSRGMDKYKNGFWGPIYEIGILRRANTSQSELGTPTAQFTGPLVRRILGRRMLNEYWGGAGAWLLRILGHAPTWLTAFLLRRRYGLNQLARIVRTKK